MRFLGWALGLSLGILTACASTAPTAERPSMHLFLLAGQSNMSGRGAVSAIDRTAHPRVFMLDASGRWVPAREPIHFDKPAKAGVGPGLAFAKALARRGPGITVGLIPVAVGGSGIEAWAPGGQHAPTGSHPWDDAVRRLRVAMQSGVLKAVLWHQGESDSKPLQAAAYEARLHDLIRRFRAVADDPDLPVLVGQLGRFSPWSEEKTMVNAAHARVPELLPNTAFVSSDGLTDKGDGTHFDAASARELGRRYAEAYLQLVK